MSAFTIAVNGVEHSVDADPNMPLLWVLRDLLGLTGTKFGCGIGECGACTVHVEGQAVRSCLTPLSSVAGKQITTIEGLAGHDGPGSHPLQRAWVDKQVAQCGYCQPGEIMTAAALLAHNPTPSEEEINTAMTGVLCRCGSYSRLLEAIQQVIAEGEV